MLPPPQLKYFYIHSPLPSLIPARIIAEVIFVGDNVGKPIYHRLVACYLLKNEKSVFIIGWVRLSHQRNNPILIRDNSSWVYFTAFRLGSYNGYICMTLRIMDIWLQKSSIINKGFLWCKDIKNIMTSCTKRLRATSSSTAPTCNLLAMQLLPKNKRC
jgi:hypothetical protein